MRAAGWLLTVALLATAGAYWVGLHGPFILDDANNLGPVAEWLQGSNTWRHALFSNSSGLYGRPLSMASFMLSGELGGYTPYSFKLGNLVLHLLCGWCGYQVLRRALAHDPRLGKHADLTAALLTALWLLHPLNVSTVLYAVQRMAQLSALFVLAALWAYLAARNAMAHEQPRRALCGLFVLFPLLVLVGLLGKENAAVAPALCLVLELAYLTRVPSGNRILSAFYGVFLALPALLASALLLRPSLLLASYAGRDFTLPQRLLSEGRALMDYVSALLLPRGPSMGVYTDDFVTSTGLMSPPTTFFALLALTAITVLAISLRKRAPSVFAGWLFFLVAHAMESSILPLELYFEHRNYLPAFGLLLAGVGLIEWLTRNLRPQAVSRRHLGMMAAAGYALMLGFATHARALVWADEGRLLTQEVQHHPYSVRANLAMAWYGTSHGAPDIASAAVNRLLRAPDPRTRELGHINRVLADCIIRGHADPEDLRQATALARPIVTLAEMTAFQNLAAADSQRACAGADAKTIADTINALLSLAHAQPDTQLPKWRLRLVAAELYARTGDWTRALPQAQLAWQPTADAPVGGFLIHVYIHNGMRADAERTYSEVARRVKLDNTNDQSGLAGLREFLDRTPKERH